MNISLCVHLGATLGHGLLRHPNAPMEKGIFFLLTDNVCEQEHLLAFLGRVGVGLFLGEVTAFVKNK